MILNLLLIVGCLISLFATGVFLIALSRAPLGVEDENGFRIFEKQDLQLPGKFKSARTAGYSHPTPNVPLSGL